MFFATELTKENPFEIELDPGLQFHLSQACISFNSKGSGKCHVVVNVVDEDEEGNESSTEKFTIACLQSDKIEQVPLQLSFDESIRAVITLEGGDNCASSVTLSGVMVDQEDEDDHGCGDPDCEDPECPAAGNPFGDDDEEFDSEEEEEEEEAPMLAKTAPKGKITEIKEKPTAQVPDKAAAKKPAQQQPAQKQQKPAAQQPAQKQQKPAAQQPKRENGGEMKKDNVKKQKN